MREIEKTCENCEYELEDIEGAHCRHCIHNAEEHFEPKKQSKQYMEIRNKAIDEFAKEICGYGTYDDYGNVVDVLEIAEQLKGGAK